MGGSDGSSSMSEVERNSGQNGMKGRVGFGTRISDIARQRPAQPAIIYSQSSGAETALSWRELDRWTNRAARLIASRGVDCTSTVAVGLSNSPEHFVAVLAAWKVGACVIPLRAALPVPERDSLLELAQPRLVVSEWEDIDGIGPKELYAGAFDDGAVPSVVPHPAKAVASGGSTGRPKLILDPNPGAQVPGAISEQFGEWSGIRSNQIQLVSAPLYHTAPFNMAHAGLFEGHTLILMDRFDPVRALDLIEGHGVTFAPMVPTMMLRMLRTSGVESRDLDGLTLYHTGGPCPSWVKHGWIRLIGAENVYEAFGSSEMVGIVAVRGDEWLLHEGTLGRPVQTEIRILDPDRRPLAPGEVGEIFMRPLFANGPTYRYIGSPPAASTPDGFISVGDMGWLDGDGYLFLADRRADMIVSGGANVFPAEIEASLSEHPGVADAVVVGVPDDEWGHRVHAIIKPVDPDAPPPVSDLESQVRARLAAYKVPKTFEFVTELPRNEAGKIRRSSLAEDRAAVQVALDHLS